MRQAIEKVRGPCVILAGAGTGKTYTIVEKIKYLIQSKTYNPKKIVCLTFSNEAVNSLHERIMRAIPHEHEPIVRTFHSFCVDLLKEHGEPIGVSPSFRILTPEDALVMMHKSFKLHPRLCDRYIAAIGNAKDIGVSLESIEDYLTKELARDKYEDIEKKLLELQYELQTAYIQKKQSKEVLREQVEHLGSLVTIKKFIQSWKAYEKIKTRKNVLDYADLHRKALELLKKYPEKAKIFDYFIIDEFQDTNKIQCDLLYALIPHKNVTIVGDLNQSIYRFRGAYKHNFSEFKEVFNVQKEDIVSLDQSYRSPDTILAIAHQLIEKNYAIKEECFEVKNAYGRTGEKTQVIELLNDKEEVRKILELIEENKNTPQEEICIIYRTHQQAARLKKALDERKIPYTAPGQTPLLKIPLLRQVVSLLMIAQRKANKLKGGESDWWELAETLSLPKQDMILMGKCIKEYARDECLTESMMHCLEGKSFSPKGTILLKNMLDNIEKYSNELTTPPHELIKKIAMTLYVPHEADTTMLANIEKFCSFAQEYTEIESPDLEAFLYHLDIMRKLGVNLQSVEEEKKGVRIMTNHATKGLEYDIVILAGMAQGKFPLTNPRKDPFIPTELLPEIDTLLKNAHPSEKQIRIDEYEQQNNLEEERRLCYVAFTRTKKKLYLLYGKKYADREYAPSQFLQDIAYRSNDMIEFIEDKEEKWVPQAPVLAEAHRLELPKKVSFSPSSLLLFLDCAKKYEYKYVYNMPEKEPLSWEEMQLGSFVHYIIEETVKRAIKTESEIMELAKISYADEIWKSVNFDEARSLLRVFYQRNKQKYNEDSLTEIKLKTVIDTIQFEGFADRIDVHPDGIEIIDYKTGKYAIAPKHRNFQLGLYAIAASELGLGRVKRLTLDMLRHEKPLEFDLNNSGIAKERNSGRMSFSIEEVRKELVATARQIIQAYSAGFQPCPLEKNCEFCKEYNSAI